MMTPDAEQIFQEKLVDYKKMVSQRQDAISKTGDLLKENSRKLSSKGKRYKNVLIILGVVVGAKAALELMMQNISVPPVIMQVLSILFLLLGIAISMVAALDKSNRYEEKLDSCVGL